MRLPQIKYVQINQNKSWLENNSLKKIKLKLNKWTEHHYGKGYWDKSSINAFSTVNS